MIAAMVTIATFGDALEANLAKGYLESAGIRAFLADDQTLGMAWHLTIALGGVKLQVADEDAQEARTILTERTTGNAAAPSSVTNLDPADSIDADTAETAQALALPAEPTPDDEIEAPPATAREQNADRAWRGAILGLLFPPLQLFVFCLLVGVLISDQRLAQPHLRRAIVATLINLPLTLLAILFIRHLLGI